MTTRDRSALAEAQERLVAALVAGGEPPEGFDAHRLAVTSRALLRKRAGEVAYTWPRLAAAYGDDWRASFARFAAGRPPLGGLRDGFDFARHHRDRLSPDAAAELATREALWVYTGDRQPRPRRLPAVRAFPGGFVIAAFGRVLVLRPRDLLPRRRR